MGVFSLAVHLPYKEVACIKPLEQPLKEVQLSRERKELYLLHRLSFKVIATYSRGACKYRITAQQHPRISMLCY
jgi:hypothetical protein